MFRLVAKWGGALGRTVSSVEYKVAASTTDVVFKAIAPSSQVEMPWHLRSVHTTAEAHKPAMPIHLEILPAKTSGVAAQLQQLFALDLQEDGEGAANVKAFDRLKYLATEVHIEDGNEAWDEVYSCLQLVHDLPKYIQYSLLSEALDRGDDDLVISTLKALVSLGIDINAQDAGGNSALYLAAIDSSTEVIDFLLTNHANASAKTITGETILDVAAKRFVHGDEDAVLEIISNLAHAKEFTPDDLQVVYDTIHSTGVTNPAEVGVDIMGKDMWQLCEEGSGDFT